MDLRVRLLAIVFDLCVSESARNIVTVNHIVYFLCLKEKEVFYYALLTVVDSECQESLQHFCFKRFCSSINFLKTKIYW